MSHGFECLSPIGLDNVALSSYSDCSSCFPFCKFQVNWETYEQQVQPDGQLQTNMQVPLCTQ